MLICIQWIVDSDARKQCHILSSSILHLALNEVVVFVFNAQLNLSFELRSNAFPIAIDTRTHSSSITHSHIIQSEIVKHSIRPVYYTHMYMLAFAMSSEASDHGLLIRLHCERKSHAKMISRCWHEDNGGSISFFGSCNACERVLILILSVLLLLLENERGEFEFIYVITPFQKLLTSFISLHILISSLLCWASMDKKKCLVSMISMRYVVWQYLKMCFFFYFILYARCIKSIRIR